ncbi:MAG: LPS-assembly protein LptD, partial [Alistipes sp.]|nr:LPS-assembly protein LptD [Alistipes sp.]
MIKKGFKYLIAVAAFALWGHLVFGTSLGSTHSGTSFQNPPPLPEDVAVPTPGQDTTGFNPNAPSSNLNPANPPEFPRQSIDDRNPYDSITIETPYHRDTTLNPRTQFLPDSFFPDSVIVDTTDRMVIIPEDSIAGDTIYSSGGFLDDIIYGRNKDSLIYKAHLKKVYIYEQGDIDYQNLNLKADFIEADLETKKIIAIGRQDDSTGVWTRPEFMEGGSVYTGDTLVYNLESKIGKTKNAATQEGDGYIIGRDIKKMADNTVNIAGGKYTTCDHIEHPHFYLAMTKARLIPGKKVIIGPSYLVLEDVPIYFPLIPFGFFPVMSGPKSGFIMPSYGEESVKGFFIREGGYYFAINDYIDVTALGGYYTLGSWEASLSSRYTKRYKYSGSLNARFSKDIIGEKGSADYVNQDNFNIQWTHTQDSKFRPNSTFAASVNFQTSGYSKHGSNNINDYVSSQTNSSVSYSKTWAGKPFSLSMRFQHSQYSPDTTVSLTFPDVAFNIQRIYPFKRKNPQGRERWYEKISMQYTGTMTNSVKVHERDLFSDVMFKNMKSGVNHTIPVSTSFNLFNYLNVSPSFNYNERWFFRK